MASDGRQPQRVPFAFLVELPFWLATPSGRHTAEFRGITLPVTLHNDLTAVFRTTSSERDWQNLAMIVAHPYFIGWNARQDSKRNYHHRQLRTVLEFGIPLPMDVAIALKEDGPTRNHAVQLLRCFAADLIPLANRLILTYQAEADDPFVYAISEWDCPLWIARTPDGLYHEVELQHYLLQDQLPRLGATGSMAVPNYTCKHLEFDGSAPEIAPERRTLSNAWGSYYRGQYDQMLVNFVTAIEVILDRRLEKELHLAGYDRPEIERRIGTDSFHSKLKAYQLLSKERIPGPIIDPQSPEVNRVRLADELNKIRNLRNKLLHEAKPPVVHEGYALKIAETMSWLARCISRDPRLDNTLNRQYILMQAYRMKMYFPTFPEVPDEEREEFEKQEEIALKLRESNVGPFRDQILQNILAKMLKVACDENDFEYASFAALAWMGFDVEEAPIDLLGVGQARERYEFRHSGNKWYVFILTNLDPSAVGEISARTRTLREQDSSSKALVLYKTQAGNRPGKLSNIVARSIDDLVIRGMTACFLDSQTIKDRESFLSIDTDEAWCSPEVEVVGHVYRVLTDKSVVCIEITKGATIEKGDLLLLRSKKGYLETHEVQSIEIGRMEYSVALGPAKCGILTDRKADRRLNNSSVLKAKPLRLTKG
ncbi:hypothetical protein Pan97_05290 [Bremerella volcania]|uniref:Uncharacterized protein n=1 Tax=Bremerella volcania TaxID=2527984 RepID=A0A518C2V6_9BACT|nr:hypothetical protein [Bremerella volcania]QDU73553.1 hypothetical protein Pan97_05290 [Bremerella volcania]